MGGVRTNHLEELKDNLAELSNDVDACLDLLNLLIKDLNNMKEGNFDEKI